MWIERLEKKTRFFSIWFCFGFTWLKCLGNAFLFKSSSKRMQNNNFKIKTTHHLYCDISIFPDILKWLHKNYSLTFLVILKVQSIEKNRQQKLLLFSFAVDEHFKMHLFSVLVFSLSCSPDSHCKIGSVMTSKLQKCRKHSGLS